MPVMIPSGIQLTHVSPGKTFNVSADETVFLNCGRKSSHIEHTMSSALDIGGRYSLIPHSLYKGSNADASLSPGLPNFPIRPVEKLLSGADEMCFRIRVLM